MAVDTRNKRGSVLGLALASLAILPLADASVDDADRVQLAYCYAGTDFTGVSGTASNDINAIAASATGAYGPSGTASNDINAVGASATGAIEVTGTASNAISALASSATGTGGEVAAVRGGGIGKRRQRRPRRIYIEGRRYTVSTPEQEALLLSQYRDRLEAERLAAELAAEGATDAPEVRSAAVTIKRIDKRINKAKKRQRAWLERLKRDDEELLTVLLH